MPCLALGDSYSCLEPIGRNTSRWQWEDWRIHAVMGMVSMHAIEFCRWRALWDGREIDVFRKDFGEVPEEVTSCKEIAIDPNEDVAFLQPEASRWRQGYDISDINFANLGVSDRTCWLKVRSESVGRSLNSESCF